MRPADGFLDAILAAPSDDTPRLVYADWLDEHGEAERAEFIRVQCRIAREPPACVTGRSLPGYGDFTARCRCPGCSLRRREYMVSRRFIQWDWLGGVESGYAPFVRPADWRRGLVHAVTLPCADFLRHAGALFACQPVTEIVLADRESAVTPDAAVFWSYDDGLELARPWMLPRALYDALGDYLREYRGDGAGIKRYPSPDDARAALSAAAVAFGRAEARKARHARQEAR